MSKLRRWGLVVLVALLASCTTAKITQPNFPPEAVKLARDHGVAIAVYYFMGEIEYNKRIIELKTRRPKSPYYLESIIPLGKVSYLLNAQGNDYVIAYLGAGGIIKDDYVLTVRHLFIHDENTLASKIWVVQRDAMLANQAELVVMSAGVKQADDYAVIKLSAPLNLPGLKIAKSEPVEGEPIVFVGSTGGLAFHMRFSWLSHASRYFTANEQGFLDLFRWEDFEYVMVFPGGPGDSGGIILNARGELVGTLYCGISCYEEQYIFSNPIEMARKFLKDNHLEHLGQ